MSRGMIILILGLIILGSLYLRFTGGDSAASSENEKPNATAGISSSQPPSSTNLAEKFKNHLLIIGGDGNVHSFDGSKLDGVKYVAFYYSASWCGPCRAFTPTLVNFYNEFKPSHPNFELIFVNDDQSDSDMINYMKGDSMPWPAVWYSEIDNKTLGAKTYAGSAIPCLVLVDSVGKVLSDTFVNGQYAGPYHVIEDIRRIVR